MKKNILFIAACALTVALGSCTNDVLDEVQQVNESTSQTRATGTGSWSRAYVLCEGTWHQDTDSESGYIKFYDNNWNQLSSFEVGDTGNDLIKYGSKLYCAVSGHDLTAGNGGLWVLNANDGTLATPKMLKYTDPKNGHPIMPRHLAAYGGKIYISLYSGAVMSIDTINYTLQKSIALGATYSEGICVANDQVYVCNSGNAGDTYASNGNTISVLPLDLSTETPMTVTVNPKLIAQAPDGTIYFNALGNYTTIKSGLYKLDAPTTPVTEMVGGFAFGNDGIYTADIDWSSYDTVLKKVSLDGETVTEIENAPEFMFGYSVSFNAFDNNIYYGQSMGDELFPYDTQLKTFATSVRTGTANVNSVVFVK